MQKKGFKKWFLNLKMTTKVIVVFEICMILAVSISVGEAIKSYADYNLNTAQEQSVFSLEAVDKSVADHKKFVLESAVQISKISEIKTGLLPNNEYLLEQTVNQLLEYSDLDFIGITDLVTEIWISS